MFKSRSVAVKKRIFCVDNIMLKVTSLSTFHELKFSNMMINRIVTDFLVLHVDIRYNDLPLPANY